MVGKGKLKMNRRLLPLCLCVYLAWAQSPATQTPSEAAPVIKMTTRLLQVSVVVHDKRGEPVGDLTKDDFVLYDKGQEQKISYFSKETSRSSPIDVPAVGEGLYSNRFVTVRTGGETKIAPLPDSLTVILIDGLNTAFADQARSKQALVKFLQQLHPGDRVAIYTLTSGLHVLHDFTSDVSSLLAAIDRHSSTESSALQASSYEESTIGVDNLDSFLDQANKKISEFYQAHRTETTLQALETIANRLSGLPGRKNLIWLSSGFPIFVGQNLNGTDMGSLLQPGEQASVSDSRSFYDELQRTWRAINDAGVAVYPVDAQGLPGFEVRSPSASAASAGVLTVVPGTLQNPAPPNPSRRAGVARPIDVRAANQMDQARSVMIELAERTGGRAFYNDNDIAGSIRAAVNDSLVTYVLYYSPAHNDWNGQFREIKIKLNKPGLEARYRKGYYALPEIATDENSRQAVLTAAAMSPLMSTGMTLLGRVMEKPTNERQHVVLSVVIDAHDVHFGRNAQGQPDATVDLLALVFTDHPDPVKQTGRVIHLALKQEQYDQMMKSGIRMTLEVEAPMNALRVRVVARDASSGKVASLDVPIK